MLQINGIKLLNPTVAVLANNHIMDQQVQGLFSTIDTLNKQGIQFVGAGRNVTEARKALIIEKNECKVGIYACCEKEFSGATETEPGANLFDPLESLDDILELKKDCDFVIILYHGGMQGYPLPTPYQQKVCRKMCDKGADLVVCQHSHIVGCEEQYNGKRIIYGQGNFLLDDAEIETWKTGLVIEIDLPSKMIMYHPVHTTEHRVIASVNPGGVLKPFLDRSEKIKNKTFVETEYSLLCKKKLYDYLMILSGKNRIVRKILNRIGISKLILGYNKETSNMVVDYFNCDTHREAIVNGLLHK